MSHIGYEFVCIRARLSELAARATGVNGCSDVFFKVGGITTIMAKGVPNLIEIFRENHYQHLNGGILKLFWASI